MPLTALPSIHRVVTGHDAAGKAIVAIDGPLPTVVELAAIPGTVFHELWNTSASPAPIDNSTDPTTGPLTLSPPPRGTRLRFVDMPPDTPEFLAQGAQRMKELFARTGNDAHSTVRADSPHPLMHRTASLDYGIVMEGEITLVLDDSEVKLAAGSVVIQRGTNHAWANRSDRPCRMLFVLIDGALAPGIASTLAAREPTGNRDAH